MKAIFISFNQAFYEDVIELFNLLDVKGFTAWDPVTGRGSRGGEPHMGDNVWPVLNSAMLAIVADPTASHLLDRLSALDASSPQQGLRAFWWEVGGGI